MFLSELSDSQKKMFMALAKRMVLADWKFEPHEVEAIERAEAELGQSLDVQSAWSWPTGNLSLTRSKRSSGLKQSWVNLWM